MNKNNIDYTLKCTSPTDYRMELHFIAEDRLIIRLFKKTKEKMARKHKIKVDGNVMAIDAFEIPTVYYKAVKIIIKRIFYHVGNLCLQDKIHLLDYDIERGFFSQESNGWNVRITLTGHYIDKR